MGSKLEAANKPITKAEHKVRQIQALVLRGCWWGVGGNWWLLWFIDGAPLCPYISRHRTVRVDGKNRRFDLTRPESSN